LQPGKEDPKEGSIAALIEMMNRRSRCGHRAFRSIHGEGDRPDLPPAYRAREGSRRRATLLGRGRSVCLSTS